MWPPLDTFPFSTAEKQHASTKDFLVALASQGRVVSSGNIIPSVWTSQKDQIQLELVLSTTHNENNPMQYFKEIKEFIQYTCEGFYTEEVQQNPKLEGL